MTISNSSNTSINDTPVSTRVKIAGLWAATLFIFAYVDIFSLYRLDFIESLAAGQIAVFDVSQTFLFWTTVYVAIPSLMIFLSLILPAKVNRWANIILAALYALTILGGCIGETWIYYIFGSVIEVILLLTVVWYAWKMPTNR